MQEKIKEVLRSSVSVKNEIIGNDLLIGKIEQAAHEITEAFIRGNRVYFCGNGGSAADAQHLAAEFSGRYYYDRPPLDSEALHVNTSYITAVGNDYSFDEIYARLLKGKGIKGDILVALSTSGNSKNIIRAIIEAHRIGMTVIGFTGSTGGLMKESCNILINVPSTDTPRIQESHITIGHIICEIVESTIFPRD
jgi:D-sedoheptulose 7-phosphate isomerase